jgi:organic hydroperoxide reductase OsmC/OhrA
MSEYTARVVWRRGPDEAFTDNAYGRRHSWLFDGGVEVPGSPSPHVVPPPLSDPSAVDPEEAFVAALSSCHMLFFLALAAKRGFVVDGYDDEAVGTLEKGADGKEWMTRVTLRPRVGFAGRAPTDEELDALHHRAHELCYIANSVRSAITVEPRRP